MTELSGEELENYGKEIFEKIGLICINTFCQVPLLEIDPEGSYSSGEHLEFDFLIPYGDICLIGEITARSDPADVEKKYRSFRRHYNLVTGLDLNEDKWLRLGVPTERLGSFENIDEFRGFFITTSMERFDVSLSAVPNIALFYRIDWKLTIEYTESIGEYTKHHFLDVFNIQHSVPGRDWLRLSQDSDDLVCASRKRIASGEVGLADVYTFRISPYKLLPLAKVFRRDELPDLSLSSPDNYQRPLLPAKLNSIRRKLRRDPEFMFPNSILVVLSSECEVTRSGTLRIPQNYAALSIIDGQHRLFSYADKGIRERNEGSQIMVTAIRFRDADDATINEYSARAFVEINTNQTRVSRSHLDAIAYPILGETTPRAIAAQIILKANERRGSSLYGFFETTQTGLGIVRATTVLMALKTITSIKKIKRLRDAQRGSTLIKKQGYENLFDRPLEELTDAETLIQQGVICFEHYFNLVKSTFHHDWPERGENNESSLAYSKMIAGFVKLLRLFIQEGLDWKSVKTELAQIRANLMELRNVAAYDTMLFDPTHDTIPDSHPRAHDDYRFLRANRQEPTTIQNWL